MQEQPNPYVKLLSVNQALEQGVEVDLEVFSDGFDRDKPEVILYCEDYTKFAYPNIYSIDKETFFDDIGTRKKYCTALEWDYSENTVDVVLNYIKDHMNTASELELWNVWLGHGELPANIKKRKCKLCDLTAQQLKEFYESELDYQCIQVIN